MTMSEKLPVQAQSVALQRDSFVIFLFLALSLFGVMQGFLSAAIPFVRDAQGLSTFLVGWLFSFYALGRLSSGFLSSHLISRGAGIPAIRLTAIGLMSAMALTWASQSVFTSFFLSFLVGIFGGTLQALVQSQIATLPEKSRSLAISEGYTWASVGVFLFPAVTGWFVSQGLPWVCALGLPLISLILVIFVNPRSYAAPKAKQLSSSKLTGTVFIFWMLFFSINVMEWGVGLWWPIFLQETHHLTTAEAVSLMSIYFGSTLVGRALNVRLVRWIEADTLFIMYLGVATAAVLTVLLAPSISTIIPALAFAGAAIGCFYPSNLATAMKYVPEEIRRISSGSANCSGLAMLSIPPMLGLVGKNSSVSVSIVLLVMVPIIMAGLLLFARRLSSLKKVSPNLETEAPLKT
ncbi:sugar MFS transporter [Microvirga sp. 2MCAF35]|uniref:MFS transporter n=1 Tax=Microvirga sp. 2MCAF35 TaxID=3232987 RepID=UPI003F9A250C